MLMYNNFVHYLPVIPLNNCKSFESVTEKYLGTTISKWLTIAYNIASRSFGLERYYVYNIFTINHRWLVVISSNFIYKSKYV